MAYYQYTVKYLCGEGDSEILVKGLYRTAINIHNPYDFLQRPVCWKVLTARFESQGAGRRSRLGWARRWSMSRIMASLIMASATSGSSS